MLVVVVDVDVISDGVDVVVDVVVVVYLKRLKSWLWKAHEFVIGGPLYCGRSRPLRRLGI